MFKYCSKTPPKQRGARLRSNFLAIPGRDAATAQGSFLPAMVVVESVNVPDIPSGDSGASNENPPAGKSESDSESEEDKVYGALLEVTDEEVATVVHNNPQPETAASLPGLPTELTVMVYKNLDVIDAVCLGLSSPRHYSIYRDLFGTGVKLNTRRIGQAGTVERSWEVVGKDLCGHCGSYRCQLYRHIDGWMGSSFVSTLPG